MRSLVLLAVLAALALAPCATRAHEAPPAIAPAERDALLRAESFLCVEARGCHVDACSTLPR